MKDINPSIKIIIASCLILALTVPNAASAELLFPNDTNKFVIDEADVLTPTEEDALSEDLVWLVDEWGTEIVVVIIESTAHYQIPDQLSDNSSNENSNNSTNGTSDNSTNGTSDNSTNGTSDNSTNGTSDNSTNGTSDEPMMALQDFSEALFDEWRIGDQEWKDGILLVLSINQSSDDSNWWIVPGLFWDENCCYFDMVGATSDASNDAGDWTEVLSIITDDLVTAVDDFWYENDGYVDPPGEELGDDYSVDGAIDTLLGAIVCFGLIAVVVVVVVLVSRSSGGGGGFSGGFRNTGYNQGGYGYNQGFGHNEQHVYHHHDQHQSNNQPAPSSKSRRSSSGGSSRGGSSRGGGSSGGSSRGGGSSGGSSRGSSGGSSRGSSGGSSRSGGSRGGGRSGGGRRR